MTQHEYPRHLWLNVELVPWQDASIHITDLGWVGVCSVFEGINAYRNDDLGRIYIFRLGDHLPRVAESQVLGELDPRFSPEEPGGCGCGVSAGQRGATGHISVPLPSLTRAGASAETARRR